MKETPTSAQEARELGSLRYFTGKPCSKGHYALRSTHTNKCIVCRNLAITSQAKKYPDKLAAKTRKHHLKLKEECFNLLGRECKCCGEKHQVFLCIDHINGDGAAHRRSLNMSRNRGMSSSFRRWLLKETARIGVKAIKKQFRILCWNCNSAFHLLGYCPHHPRRK